MSTESETTQAESSAIGCSDLMAKSGYVAQRSCKQCQKTTQVQISFERHAVRMTCQACQAVFDFPYVPAGVIRDE